ncbi:putative toxin-antitoxin system toxin component, PIN family [Candidatus Woesearchaeota archaeon]|nr:putative toxin-antitoxin system toxin component, PIN family [Candidatus Woesearchaeota archaeon]
MLRVVPDTNVLISALIVEGNEYRLIEKCFVREIIIITSVDVLDEFKEVALRPKFGFSEEEVNDFVNALIEAAEVVMPKEKVRSVCRDPDDNKLLEAALEGNADYIISGDKDLLVLKKFRSAKIVTAAELLRNI